MKVRADGENCIDLLLMTYFLFLDVWVRSKREALQLAKKVPMIRRQIDGELLKIRQEFEDSMIANIGHLTYRVKLPRQGLTKNEILQLLGDHMALGRYDWRHGSVSGAVYGHRDELIELVTAVYGQTSYTNPLHPDIFPGICKMEAEVVRMCCHLFHGGTKSCGTVSFPTYFYIFSSVEIDFLSLSSDDKRWH